MELKQLKTIVISFILILLVLVPSPLFVGGTVKAAIATISSPYPANQSTDVELTPTLNITINDADGHDMNITWYSNSSGSWEVFGVGSKTLDAYDFEEATELENWTTTGIRYDDATYAHSGTWSLEIEGVSKYAYHNLSLANYTKVNISWWSHPNSIETDEPLYLRFYNGTDWATIRTVEGWQVGIEDTYTNYYDELDTDTYVFNDDCKICWNISASNTFDRYYLDDINITYSNNTGSMSNGTYHMVNSNFSDYGTIYYWNVSVNDGTDTNNSDVFYFATEVTMTINFAGNLSDSGGPYWRPPGESVALAGDWSDGYYTNDSRQQEDWIYINLTIPGNMIDSVKLHWYNQSSDAWDNATDFVNSADSYWELNTSGNIQTSGGHNYSFDIYINDTLGNSKIVWWNKTGLGGSCTRRYVQLNCTTVNIDYVPYYMYNASYLAADTAKEDRLHHDQGPDGSTTDAGYLHTTTPSEEINERYCGGFVGYYFDESQCIESFSLNNIYYHIWWSTSTGAIRTGWDKEREDLDTWLINWYATNDSNANSQVFHDNGEAQYSDIYSLDTHFLNITDNAFTDNNIYEFSVKLYLSTAPFPAVISNRSFTSFVLFNVPDNATLNASHADTDGDGLSDWTELYVNYTNPFLADTDNDGVNDYNETLSGSDPNNYTDTLEADAAIGYPDGYFYFETEAPHANSLIVAYDETWHYFQMS